MRLVAFCEAEADFRIASDLLDQVLRSGPTWLGDLLDASPENVRSWHSDGSGRSYFLVRALTQHADRLRVRVPHGHFDHRPGAADALLARTAFAITRSLAKQDPAVRGAIFLRDLDDQPQRRTGHEQARQEATSWATFEIVVGSANPKREAWVLCGFQPSSPDEHARLGAMRRELGFQPHIDAHQLDAKDEQATRSAKRVLRILTDDDRDRERQCWRDTPLETLKQRGQATGLTDFLNELEQRLLPLVMRQPP